MRRREGRKKNQKRENRNEPRLNPPSANRKAVFNSRHTQVCRGLKYRELQTSEVGVKDYFEIALENRHIISSSSIHNDS